MIKFEVDERNRSITPCPHGMIDFEDNIRMVGSRDCSGCLYCFDIDRKKSFSCMCRGNRNNLQNITL